MVVQVRDLKNKLRKLRTLLESQSEELIDQLKNEQDMLSFMRESLDKM